MKILIVDDDSDSALMFKGVLEQRGHSAVAATESEKALALLREGRFDVLMADWMMPGMDGIELVRQVRKSIKPIPLIVMVTSISSPQARKHALLAGADDYIVKPYEPKDAAQRLVDLLARRSQPPPAPSKPRLSKPAAAPPFVGVALATSTGGPAALGVVLKSLPEAMRTQAAVFIVMHGPSWMIESMPAYLQDHTPLTVRMAEHRRKSEVGHVYIAPGDRHLMLKPGTCEQRLDDGEKENFVRPSADPLFRSVADHFGRFSVAAVLTGMGRDGTRGAASLRQAGSLVIAQDPKTAIAASMPETLISAGLAKRTAALWDMGALIGREVAALHEQLRATSGR